MKRIARITNAYPNSGVGSRAYELAKRMRNTTDFTFEDIMLDGTTRALIRNHDILHALSKWPSFLNSKSMSWIRLAPLLKEYDGYDLTNQSLSFIAKKRQLSIVTVHDIIELTHPQSSGATLLNKYLQSGIPKAKHIIAVSEFTKQQVCDYFTYPEERITVIPNGVSDAFHPVEHFSETQEYKQALQDLQLEHKAPFILFVGSEHPRKNLQLVLQAIANLKQEFPDITLIKVGGPGIAAGRNSTLSLMDSLGIHDRVVFVEDVAELTLINLYRLAHILVAPSFLEGFGLTPLQAMACGTPVVCSNTTSLPEVVGNAALTCAPDNLLAFTENIRSVLTDRDLAQLLTKKGLEQAKKFSWDQAAKQTLEVYKKVFL